jgi:hypothetical protein
MRAAERVDRQDEVRERIRLLATGSRFMTDILGRELGLTVR